VGILFSEVTVGEPNEFVLDEKSRKYPKLNKNISCTVCACMCVACPTCCYERISWCCRD